MEITYSGIEAATLDRWRSTGLDDSGNPIEPFVDEGGDWPLRCCLRNSQIGERIAIVSASPFPWSSAYAARGPVVVHADECVGSDGRYPEQFDARDQVMRAYGDDDGRSHTLVYDLNRLVAAGEDLHAAIGAALNDPRVEFVQCYNVKAGCYSFTARRAPTNGDSGK